MKLRSLLLVAAVLPATFAQADEQSLSEQLLQTLDEFPTTDPLISALVESIESSRGILDNTTITRRNVPNPSSRSRVACRLLKVIMPRHYVDSTNQSSYNQLRTKNWSSNCDLPAACFLAPNHSAQVAVALQVISLAQSKFAVRSGGHNPNPGFAGVGGEGVTIDTQGFNTLQLSPDKRIATVGAGLRFGAVQSFLDQHGVAVVSGRNKDVGIAGLLLGGGHPIVNSLTGLAADNIHSAEVVLSNFRVVKASRTQHPDLFRALKGGGNNFGIVTKFELKTTMPRNIWYRIAAYSNSDPRAILDALVAVQRKMESDPKAGIQMTCSPTGFTVSFVYAEHTRDPNVFSPFRNLTPTTESTPATNGSTLNFIQLQSPPQPEASRDTVGVTTYLDTDLYLDIYKQYLSVVKQHGGPTTVFLLPIQTFGAAAVRMAEQNGGNFLGTAKRAQTWWNPIAQWTNPADDAKVHKALVGFAGSIRSSAQRKGLHDKYIFANIASRDQNVLASYGQRNLDFLRAVSRRYDPSSIFQRLQNSGFLLSKA